MNINWQPIASVPLDGTDALIYDGYDVWRAFYCSNGTCWKTSAIQEYHNEKLFHEPVMWLPISDLLQPLGHLL